MPPIYSQDAPIYFQRITQKMSSIYSQERVRWSSLVELHLSSNDQLKWYGCSKHLPRSQTFYQKVTFRTRIKVSLIWHDPHFIRSPTFAGTTPVQILRSPLSHWLQARADSGGPKCIHRSCITSKRLSLFCVTMPSSQVRQGILGKCNFRSNYKNYHLPGPHSHIVWKAPHCVSSPPQKNMSSVLSDILFTIRSMIFVQFQLNMDKRQTWTIEWKEANL